MKKTLSVLISAGILALSGCAAFQKATTAVGTALSSPNTVTTLKILGATVDATMSTAAHLYHDGQISTAQWNTIASLHDTEFLPAYNAAVAAVQYDTGQPAAPSLIALGGQIAAALETMTTTTATH
jgi:hypothetical protein